MVFSGQKIQVQNTYMLYVQRIFFKIVYKLQYPYLGVISVPEGPFLASWDRPNTTKYPTWKNINNPQLYNNKLTDLLESKLHTLK